MLAARRGVNAVELESTFSVAPRWRFRADHYAQVCVIARLGFNLPTHRNTKPTLAMLNAHHVVSAKPQLEGFVCLLFVCYTDPH